MLSSKTFHTLQILLSIAVFLAAAGTAGAAVRVVSPDELKSKNGKDAPEMWLSILGEVYDVSSGKDHYGEGSPYHVFLGRDASASFATGNFTEAGSSESLLDLDPPIKLTQIDDWRKFYEDSDKYTLVGVLEGKLYDANGNPTEELKQVRERIAAGRLEREQKKAENARKLQERKEKEAQEKAKAEEL